MPPRHQIELPDSRLGHPAIREEGFEIPECSLERAPKNGSIGVGVADCSAKPGWMYLALSGYLFGSQTLDKPLGSNTGPAARFDGEVSSSMRMCSLVAELCCSMNSEAVKS